MPFAKGTPKPANSGRKKGSGNKATVAAICERFHFDPFEAMIHIAQDEDTKPDLRFRVAAELAQYVRPKLRTIELSGEGDRSALIQLIVMQSADELPEPPAAPGNRLGPVVDVEPIE